MWLAVSFVGFFKPPSVCFYQAAFDLCPVLFHQVRRAMSVFLSQCLNLLLVHWLVNSLNQSVHVFELLAGSIAANC